MKTISVYLDESLTTRDMLKLKHEIMSMPYVIDVEHPRHNGHDLTIDYEPHAGLPGDYLRRLRSKGFHPDITSA